MTQPLTKSILMDREDHPLPCVKPALAKLWHTHYAKSSRRLIVLLVKTTITLLRSHQRSQSPVPSTRLDKTRQARTTTNRSIVHLSIYIGATAAIFLLVYASHTYIFLCGKRQSTGGRQRAKRSIEEETRAAMNEDWTAAPQGGSGTRL